MERLCFCLSLLGCQDDNCVEIVWTNEVRANAQQEVRKPPRGHGFAVVQHKIRFQRSAMLKRYRLKIKADAYLLTLWSALLLTFGFALSKGISAFSLRWGYPLHVHRAHHSFLISERLKHKGRRQGFIFWGQQQQQKNLAVSIVDWWDPVQLLMISGFIFHYGMWEEMWGRKLQDIAVWLKLEETSGSHLVQPPCKVGSPTVGCTRTVSECFLIDQVLTDVLSLVVYRGCLIPCPQCWPWVGSVKGAVQAQAVLHYGGPKCLGWLKENPKIRSSPEGPMVIRWGMLLMLWMTTGMWSLRVDVTQLAEATLLGIQKPGEMDWDGELGLSSFKSLINIQVCEKQEVFEISPVPITF